MEHNIDRCVDCSHYNACAQMIVTYNNLVAQLNDFFNDIGSKQKANGLGFPYETEKGRLVTVLTAENQVQRMTMFLGMYGVLYVEQKQTASCRKRVTLWQMILRLL